MIGGYIFQKVVGLAKARTLVKPGILAGAFTPNVTVNAHATNSQLVAHYPIGESVSVKSESLPSLSYQPPAPLHSSWLHTNPILD